MMEWKLYGGNDREVLHCNILALQGTLETQENPVIASVQTEHLSRKRQNKEQWL
jgi:hypothetical protein